MTEAKRIKYDDIVGTPMSVRSLVEIPILFGTDRMGRLAVQIKSQRYDAGQFKNPILFDESEQSNAKLTSEIFTDSYFKESQKSNKPQSPEPNQPCRQFEHVEDTV